MSAVPTHRRGIGSAVRSTFLNVCMVLSLNLAILIISFTVPYTVVTQIASGYASSLDAEKALFMEGLQSAYIWFAGLNSLAIIPSVLSGKSSKAKKENQRTEPKKVYDLDGNIFLLRIREYIN